MAERTKTAVDTEIRSAGIALVDITNLTAIASKWIGTTEVALSDSSKSKS